MNQIDNDNTLDKIFNMNKIKFSVLDELGLQKRASDESPDKVRIFINLELVHRYLFTDNVEDFVSIQNKEELQKHIISSTINLAQHYRLYFAKLNIQNEVYIYWNYNKSSKYKNSEYIESYREKYDSKYFNKTNFPVIQDSINKSVKTLRNMFKYVNEVYLISHDTIESSVIPYMFYQDQDPSKKYMNVIITRDLYDYQYVNYDFIVLNPKKTKLISKDNIFDIKDIPGKDIGYNFISSIVSVKGDSNKGIPKLNISIKKLSEYINKGINNLIITKNTTSGELISRVIEDDHDRNNFIQNFNCVSIPTQYKNLTTTERFDIFSQVIDKYDDIGLEYLNDRFFINHLIMIVDSKSQQIIKRNDYK